MFTKVFCMLVLVTAVTLAEHGHSSQHIHRHEGDAQEVNILDKHGHHLIDYLAYPKYEYVYKVDDKHTGDHKQQEESRDGHNSHSKYSLHVEHIVPKKHHHEKKEHHHEKKEHHHEKAEHAQEQSKHHSEHHKHAHETHHHEKPKHHSEKKEEVLVDYYAYPKYEFGYKVDDDHTGDHKRQYEHRDGHDTKSDYSLHIQHIVAAKHHHSQH